MRFVRFSCKNKTGYGILKEDGNVFEIKGDPFSFFADGSQIQFTGRYFSLEELKLLAPCLPSKIVCLGLNYRPHARETNQPIPSNPIIFLKPPTAVIGPGDSIILPHNYHRVDYEGELAIVIGKKAHFVPREKAHDYVLGYTCFNDVTERQFQKEDGQWTRAKSFDTFAPIGPWIENEVDPDNLKLETRLNGLTCQSESTGELIFDTKELISFISEIMTLLPGDVISTGTPAGIGPMKPGDTVEVIIEKIGILQNRVVAHDSRQSS